MARKSNTTKEIKATATKETKTTKKSNGGTTMKKATEFEMLMAAINGINNKVDVLETEIATIKEAQATGKVTKAKATSKATTKKSSSKGTAKKVTGKAKGKSPAKKAPAKKPTTYAEAIAKWEKENGITTESKKAYIEACQEITAEMMAENEEMVTVDKKGNKTYDKNYYVGKKWKREFDKRLVAMGYKPKYKVK